MAEAMNDNMDDDISDYSSAISSQLSPPNDMHFTTHDKLSEYTVVGWLLFSTPCIYTTALEDEIILQIHAKHPHLIWHTRGVAVK